MTQRHLEQLSSEDCKQLLQEATIGRVVFLDSIGPGAIPVNYGLAGDNIIFRIERQSGLLALLGDQISFEVDYIETATASGWSVLVRGFAREVPMEEVPDLLKQIRGTLPRPWAEGIHNVWVEIKSQKVTGRRLTFIHKTVL